MLTPSQCRAARALLAWSQTDLCEAAKVGRATLANFESEKSTPYERTLRDIQDAFTSAEIEFINTPEREGVARKIVQAGEELALTDESPAYVAHSAKRRVKLGD